MAKVIYATAEYTGGGIYQYNGRLENGNYFLCFTDWEEYMLELDADPGYDANFMESGQDYWQKEHTVRELPVMESYETLLEAFHWILRYCPKGHYDSSDIDIAFLYLEEDIKAYKRDEFHGA